MVVAQAAVEYGALSGVAAGVASTWNRLEGWIGRGNNVYIVAAAVVVLVVFLLRRGR